MNRVPPNTIIIKNNSYFHIKFKYFQHIFKSFNSSFKPKLAYLDITHPFANLFKIKTYKLACIILRNIQRCRKTRINSIYL